MSFQNHNIDQNLFEQIFKDTSVKARVTLRASKTKGANFDKYRDVGYEQTNQNPLFIKTLTKAVSANSLIIREIGLVESGAIQMIVQDKDVPLLKLADKILVNNVEYTPFNKALGGKLQIFALPFNYSKIIVFRISDQ